MVRFSLWTGAASAAIVQAPVVGLKAGPRAGRGPVGTNETYRIAAETSMAARALVMRRVRWRRGEACPVAAGRSEAFGSSFRAGAAIAGSSVTGESLSQPR